jgi:hypothetical protein
MSSCLESLNYLVRVDNGTAWGTNIFKMHFFAVFHTSVDVICINAGANLLLGHTTNEQHTLY